MDPKVLEYLRYGALAISAFCLFLSFFLVYRGDRSNTQVFGFMVFSALIFLGSIVADGNSGLSRFFGAEDRQETSSPEATALPESISGQPNIRFWDSGWFPVESGKEYELRHEMNATPLTATIWYRREGSSDIHMMDGIYSSDGGYGAWIMDLNSNSMIVSTGIRSSTSGYGRYNHWMAIDRGAPNGSEPRSLRIVVIY